MATLCLLSALPNRSVGDKRLHRGLDADGRCSVTAYSTASASLTLGHLYPKGTNVAAAVDVRLVLGTLLSEMTRVGEWVNVIGYVTERRETPDSDSTADAPSAPIQALAVWPTGPLDIQRYERAFDGQTARTAGD
ncbi:telomere capping, CST complex subunit domain-containing protein [Purpureocillium lavendulum]|uniref:Telomere capping, CST complex subunit domain-containing protein n=1 Tax=Purpureocillium lavendulum TaxID=1247861 RepID=A0AB34FZ42_9HYPO|nr:telomere capping, CST complex subunit domain-containing protein [Purpureocillium lavendulum]